ncbi:MAG: tetratricopeptide repeat protein [Planctomycetaceae bacterium]|nr:tetratricopeptide repeat protein [Planctomycetaceae bacterium]
MQHAMAAFQRQAWTECRDWVSRASAAARASLPAVTLQALCAARTGDRDTAEQLLKGLIARGQADPSAFVNLGEILRQGDKLAEAEQCLRQAVRLAPKLAEGHYNLGVVLGQQQNDPAAIECYQAVLKLQPQHHRAKFNLANSLRREGRIYPARDHLQQVTQLRPDWAEAWQNLAATQAELGETDAALASYRRAGELSPEIADKCAESIAGVLITRDEIPAAAEMLRRAAANRPERFWQELRADLLCPAVPDSVAAIDEYRAFATERLTRAVEEARALPRTDDQDGWFEPPMEWAYHGCDDRPLKTLFAQLYLDRIAPLERTPNRDRSHVGFVVTSGHEGVFNRCLGEIIRQLPNDELLVSIVCPRIAANTLRFVAPDLGRFILETPTKPVDAAAFLATQSLDLLYYWEIGTDAFNYLLPFWQPAPWQGSSWGWPITSGNPRANLFFTSRHVEAEDAAGHFTERLVWLTGAMTIYPRPTTLQPRPTERYGLRPGQHLYVCQQNLRKWHPEFDAILHDLFDADPDAVLGFIGHTQPTITQKLMARLRRSIPDIKQRTKIFPFMPREEYLELLRAADVALDTPRYGGGGNTVADAFATGTPLVTLTGRYHRNRYGSGMLRRAGLGELATDSPADYVQTAVQIARDAERREALSRRMSDQYAAIFENPATVTELRTAMLSIIGE